MDGIALLADNFGWPALLACAVTGFIVSVIGGLAGYGTGLLLPLVLVPLVGPEPVVPIIGLTALFTNGGRILAFRKDVDLARAWRVMLFAIPFAIIGTRLYDALSGRGVLLLLGLTLLAMVPLRRWLKRRAFQMRDNALVPFGALFGLLVGGTSGAGVMLISALMATGMQATAVIATDAVISLVVGLVKTLSFARLGTLTLQHALLALIIGIATFPGGYIARWLVTRLSVRMHGWILEGAVIVGALVLLARAAAGGVT